jgi:hypothetical protein
MPLFVDNGSSPVDGITSNEHAVLNHAGVPGVGTSLGGTGGLGSVTIAAGATTINGVRNYINFTIDPGATVTHDALRAMHLKCLGFFLNNGTIDVNGKGMPGSAVNYQGGCSAAGGDGGGGSAADTGGPGCRRAGLFGGGRLLTTSLDTTPFPPGSGARPSWVTDLVPVLPIAAPGGGGGSGAVAGTSDSGTGGDGGGCIIIEAQGNVTEGTINATGDAGANAVASGVGGAGGGGGGGGGMVLVLYGGTLTTGTIGNVGGNGGNGVSGGIPGIAGEQGLLRRIEIP